MGQFPRDKIYVVLPGRTEAQIEWEYAQEVRRGMVASSCWNYAAAPRKMRVTDRAVAGLCHNRSFEETQLSL